MVKYKRFWKSSYVDTVSKALKLPHGHHFCEYSLVGVNLGWFLDRVGSFSDCFVSFLNRSGSFSDRFCPFRIFFRSFSSDSIPWPFTTQKYHEYMAISILYLPRKIRWEEKQDNILETSNGRKILRMAPISTIFRSIESRRCQLKFAKIAPSKKSARAITSKTSRIHRKSCPDYQFLTKNKIEIVMYSK